jgi:hypothetical protein
MTTDTHAAEEHRIRERAYELWEQAGRPAEAPDRFWHEAKRQIGEAETEYDKVVADSFPASDPPANSGITSSDDAAPAAVAVPRKTASKRRGR